MPGGELDFDAVLDLCRDHHRRIVLAVLADEQRPLTTNDLAKTIVKHNHHAPLAEVSGELLTQIKTSLYHVHLPKLVAAGVVDYDDERELVAPTEQFERIEPKLSAIFDADPAFESPLEL